MVHLSIVFPKKPHMTYDVDSDIEDNDNKVCETSILGTGLGKERQSLKRLRHT